LDYDNVIKENRKLKEDIEILQYKFKIHCNQRDKLEDVENKVSPDTQLKILE